MIHLRRPVPVGHLLGGHQPPEEVLHGFGIGGVPEDAVGDGDQAVEASLGALRVQPVIRDLAHVGQIALGRDHDAHRVVGARDLAGQERLVVGRVQPADAVVEAGLLVERPHVVHRLGGLGGIEGDGLAVLGHDLATVRPEERQQPRVVVGVAVSHRHAVGMAGLLQLPSRVEELFPRVRELLDARLLEPVAAIRHALADVPERHRLPLAFPHGEVLDFRVPAALLFAGLLGDVGDVQEPFAIEPLLLDPARVDRGLALDDRDQARHGGSAGRHDLVVELDARLLLVARHQDVLEVIVELLHVRALAQERDLRGLGFGPARTPACADGGSGGARRSELDEIAP